MLEFKGQVRFQYLFFELPSLPALVPALVVDIRPHDRDIQVNRDGPFLLVLS